MQVEKHLRILSTIFLVVSTPVFLIGLAVFLWAGYNGGEGALIGFPAALAAIFSVVPLVAGIAIRYGRSWGLLVAVICAVPMLFSIVLTPLAAYTFAVAYVKWKTAPGAPGPAPAGATANVHAHVRILASLWTLVAVFPTIMGAALLLDGVNEFSDKGFANVTLYSGPLLCAIGVMCAKVAFAISKRRTWAIGLAAVTAVPMLALFPAGTAGGIYALWVAFIHYRDQYRSP